MHRERERERERERAYAKEVSRARVWLPVLVTGTSADGEASIGLKPGGSTHPSGGVEVQPVSERDTRCSRA